MAVLPTEGLVFRAIIAERSRKKEEERKRVGSSRRSGKGLNFPYLAEAHDLSRAHTVCSARTDPAIGGPKDVCTGWTFRPQSSLPFRVPHLALRSPVRAGLHCDRQRRRSRHHGQCAAAEEAQGSRRGDCMIVLVALSVGCPNINLCAKPVRSVHEHW